MRHKILILFGFFIILIVSGCDEIKPYLDWMETKLNEIVPISNNNIAIEKTPIIQKQDSLMSKCMDSFKECKEITIKKYNVRISISEIKEIDSIEEANDFFTIWGNPLGFRKKFDEGILPSILIAYSVKYPHNDMQLPSVAICDKNGELTDYSKRTLLCG